MPRPRQVRPVEHAEAKLEDVVWAPRRTTIDPAAPILRRGDKKLAGVAGAVVALTVGLANILPGGGSAQAVVTAPADSTNQLHGIGPNEPLPTVTPDPSQPSGAFPVLGPQPIAAPATPSSPPTQVTVPSGASRSIPPVVLAAYESAAAELAKEQPNCHLPWELLGGIGYVESDNANNGAVNSAGEMLQPILGPALNGTDGFALILNTDPALDGAGTYARAVGPMQFLPSTWQVFGRSATGRTPDPENVFDAALTTAGYLCDGGGDLSTRDGLLGAVYRYNQSWQYVSLVLTWAGLYAGAFPVTVPGATPTPTPSPTASTAPKPTTPAPTATPVPSASVPPSPQPTPTLAPPTGSATPAPSAPTTSPTPSGSPNPIETPTPTASPTGSPVPTESPTPTTSPTPTASASSTPAATGQPTPDPSDAPTTTPSP